jgi:putative serine protease PepD
VEAELVGVDASTDIAVLDVDVPAEELTPLPLGDSASVRPGEAVVAIGSPFGLEGSITAGIVSAVGRTMRAPNGYSIAGSIQTDAPINTGNSGGPLIDAAGSVIGVNAQIESSSGGNEGVGFAIPIDTVRRVAEALLAGEAVAYPYLGAQLTDAPSGGGAEIAAVQPGSPAEEAGLREGDVVVAVDGRRIRSSGELVAAVGALDPGDAVTLRVTRDGEDRDIDVTLGTRPS